LKYLFSNTIVRHNSNGSWSMSKNGEVVASHVMVVGGCVLDAKSLAEDGDEILCPQAQTVTVLVAMPLALKRKFQTEAKRRQQSLSEFICARCDFREDAGDI